MRYWKSPRPSFLGSMAVRIGHRRTVICSLPLRHSRGATVGGASDRGRGSFLWRGGARAGRADRDGDVSPFARPRAAASLYERRRKWGPAAPQRGAEEGQMTPPGRPVEEDDLHARIDGQLPRERAEEVDAYLAAHPEEQERFSKYAGQREALRATFSSQAYAPIPNRLRVAQLRRRRRRQLGGIAAAMFLIVLGGIGSWATRDLAGPMSSMSLGAVASMMPSRPGEFHPEPLTDPDLTLSRHPARATE